MPDNPVRGFVSTTPGSMRSSGSSTARVGPQWAGISREELLAILHHPAVVRHIVLKAKETIDGTGTTGAFSIVLQNRPDTIRPRAYVVPNSRGIRLEIKQGVLLKACLGMAGK